MTLDAQDANARIAELESLVSNALVALGHYPSAAGSLLAIGIGYLRMRVDALEAEVAGLKAAIDEANASDASAILAKHQNSIVRLVLERDALQAELTRLRAGTVVSCECCWPNSSSEGCGGAPGICDHCPEHGNVTRFRASQPAGVVPEPLTFAIDTVYPSGRLTCSDGSLSPVVAYDGGRTFVRYLNETVRKHWPTAMPPAQDASARIAELEKSHTEEGLRAQCAESANEDLRCLRIIAMCRPDSEETIHRLLACAPEPVSATKEGD
jgi:hypothetical protein